MSEDVMNVVALLKDLEAGLTLFLLPANRRRHVAGEVVLVSPLPAGARRRTHAGATNMSLAADRTRLRQRSNQLDARLSILFACPAVPTFQAAPRRLQRLAVRGRRELFNFFADWAADIEEKSSFQMSLGVLSIMGHMLYVLNARYCILVKLRLGADAYNTPILCAFQRNT